MSRALTISAIALALALGPALAAAQTPAPAPAPAPPPAPAQVQTPAKTSGFAAAFRTGYALPGGRVGAPPNGAGIDVTDEVRAMIPLHGELTYRVNPHVHVGGALQVGFGFINKDQVRGCDGCTLLDFYLGALLALHMLPEGKVDPWCSIGAGIESLSLSDGTSSSARSQLDFTGVQFLTVEGGVDVVVSNLASLGPFVSFSVGEYLTYTLKFTDKTGGSSRSVEQKGDLNNPDTHHWVAFGLRAHFNF